MNRVMHSSKTDKWSTPQWLFDLLDAEFHFTCDVCATAEDTKVPDCYFTPEMDGLKQKWGGRLWMNLPYGRKGIPWLKKAYLSALAGATVVGLLPARVGARYWARYCEKAYEIRFVTGRLKFGNAKNSAPFDSAIVIWKPGRHKQARHRRVDAVELQSALFGCNLLGRGRGGRRARASVA
jgi:phage N-6-adenine-methyltransferase